MAHIGYTWRYMTKAGFDVAVDLRHYGDEIETLLRMLVINGKGIEINCSGLRNTLLNEPIPSVSIIGLFRELEGEIITVGSEAHRTADASDFIEEGYAILRQAGF